MVKKKVANVIGYMDGSCGDYEWRFWAYGWKCGFMCGPMTESVDLGVAA